MGNWNRTVETDMRRPLKTGQGHHATGGGGEGRDENTETTTEAGT